MYAPIKRHRLLSQVAPINGSYFFYIPMWSILPGIYAKYFQIEITSVAAVVLLVRIFDGFSDPTIGYLADRHRESGGSRKPWVLAGGIGLIIACYCLFIPPKQVSTAYYLFWSLAFFLAFTTIEVPHLAWCSELTTDYNQRASVFSMRTFSMSLGILLFYALPLLPIYPNNNYTPEVLEDAAKVGGLFIIFGCLAALLWAPPGRIIITDRKDSLKLLISSLIHNRPLLIYLSAYIFTGLCLGMWFGLLYIYMDSYLCVGTHLAIMFTAGALTSILAIPFWTLVIEKTNKHIAWSIGMTLFCLQLISTSYLNMDSPWILSLILIVIAHAAFSCNNVASMSALGDVIDYGKLKFRKDRGATYFAINGLLYKVGLGLGSGVSLGIAGQFGFDPSEIQFTETAAYGLKLGFIYLPVIFGLISIVFILRTPINRRRQKIIERRLASKLIDAHNLQ